MTQIVGTCDIGSDVCACVNATWNMTAVIGDVGEGLYSVFSSDAGNSSNFSSSTFKPGHRLGDGIVTAKLRWV